ncbi:hypothetical protein [Marinobacter fonticola]|uniref:hypothetical protein n=1 Tax=Marinobacter fonticola TaxID=2603215 RepID=UPI0011E721E3|nr:hypothetical protein [Marinobacter fonticola]
MERALRVTLATLATVFVAGCANVSGITTKGETDELNDHIEVSSELFAEPFMGYPAPTDYYFEAKISKQTGLKFYELHLAVNKDSWKRWDQVRFDFDGEPAALPLIWQRSDMTCTDYGCTYSELGVAGIDEAMVEYIAAQPEPVTMVIGSARVEDSLAFTVYPQEAEALLEETRQLQM